MADSLFSLTGEFLTLLDMSASADEEDQQMFKDTLEGILACIDGKADNYAHVMTQIKGRADMVSKEINRLTEIEARLNNAHKRMSDALKASMEATGRKVIQTDLHTIKVVKNGGLEPMTIIESRVPEEYLKTEIKQSPDKDKIRKALKEGKELDFASLGERGTHLKID